MTTATEDKPAAAEGAKPENSDFIRDIIRDDLAAGKHSQVVSRFPPEPNGYLHIGHAKAICLNFGVAQEFGGRTHLRFDDTNPTTEDPEYVDAIEADIRWLGFDWGRHLYFASDYFEELYQLALVLIRRGLAYVCELSEDEMREYRGTLTEKGKDSPWRERTALENLDLFARMRAGEFEPGTKVLRAKIDMGSPNMKMRDPLLYRIKKAHHYRTGDDWCIYPLYDYAHPLSDAIEKVTHSLCSLEFENNREFYDWVVRETGIDARPRQIEFARLNLTYTVLSKRKLLKLVGEGDVEGWDDPRMPTLSGLRRRGYTPEAIRNFAERIGVARTFNVIDVGLLEHSLREDLNTRAPRVMGVLRPLKVVIENYPEGEVEYFDAPYWPHDVPKEGSRPLPFSRELYIDREDFEAVPPPGFHRLSPGREVRLRYAYILRCDGIERDEDGEVSLLRCSYDPESRGGQAADGRQVKGTIHWVSAPHAVEAEVRLYDRLFTAERPDEGDDFRQSLNPKSLERLKARLEPSLAEAAPGTWWQLERQGYFFADPQDSLPGRPVLNRTVGLRDSWAKIAQKPEATEAGRLAAEKAAQRAAHKARQRELNLVESRPAEAAAELPPGSEEFLEAAGSSETARNLFKTELLREAKTRPLADLPFGGNEFGELAKLVDGGEITATAAKKVLATMLERGGNPGAIVDRLGLRQLRDEGALQAVVNAVIADFPDQVAAYRGGKVALLGFLLGQLMKRSAGADPQLAKRLLEAALS
jgi:glutaminyl-tRNA synthetase